MKKKKDFAKLGDSELNLAAKFVKRSGGNALTNAIMKSGGESDVKVAYIEQDNFYKAVVQTGPKIYVGVAKRNPNDPVVEQIGKNIAFTRALSSEALVVA